MPVSLAVILAVMPGVAVPEITPTHNEDANLSTHDPGWPELASASIRPGVRIGDGCTASFVFSSLDNTTLYIGTASHCMGGYSPGDRVDIAHHNGGGILRYCSWMYALSEDHCPESEFLLDSDDFALIEIRSFLRTFVHPALIHWGGPTGIADQPPPLIKTHTYGNSWMNPVKPLRPMEGYVVTSDERTTRMYAVRPGIFGDSGSPVVQKDGAAIGTLVAVNAPSGQNIVANVAHSLDSMRSNAGIEVELKTWHVLDNGTLPSLQIDLEPVDM